MKLRYNLFLRLASVLLLCFFFSFNLSAQTYTRTTDSLALVALYNATDGANWTNTWDLRQPISSWYGIQLNTSGRIEVIDLDGELNTSLPNFWKDGNNLIGHIPSEVWTITQLKVLSLSRNILTGTLPPTIANLQELEVLSLYTRYSLNDGLTGNIPSEIGRLSKLKQLFLGENSLSGPIPASLNQLINLAYLNLEDNNFTSYPNLRNLSLLKRLRISGNSFASNPIPDWIYELRNLEQFFAREANLTGSISSEIGQLSKLQILSLEGNNLTGSIPETMGTLQDLIFLLLSKNQLTGSIPPSLTNHNIRRFMVDNNQLEGIIPDFSKSSELYDMDVSNNKFTFVDIVPHITPISNAINTNSRGLKYVYAPQANLGTSNREVNILANTEVPLTLGNNLSTNIYELYKDGVLLSRMVGNNIYTFDNVTIADAGDYYVEITNPTAPDLILRSFTVTIKVTDHTPFIPSAPTDIFASFSWLSLIVSPENCSNEKITAYANGRNFYFLIENREGQKLYNEEGIFYCTHTPTYDCVAAYDLTKVSDWTCENATTVESPSTPEENSNNTTTLFQEYTWLNGHVNPVDCSDAQITVYQTGAYQYLLVNINGTSKLYNNLGQLYCTGAPNYDCVAAYNLTEVIATWACEEATENDSINEENTDSGAEQETYDLDPIFDKEWITSMIDIGIGECDPYSIDVYQSGSHLYYFITIDGISKLYNETGQLYCTNASNYDCLEAYNLTEFITSLFCGDNTDNSSSPDTNLPDVFEEFPWLITHINPNDCSNNQIVIFLSGGYKYIFVDKGSDRKLYNEAGQLYCTQATNYDCLEAYNLGSPIRLWNCGDNLQESFEPFSFRKTRSSSNQLTVYPNPTNSIVNIQLPYTATAREVNLIDINGKTVLRDLSENTTMEWDVSNLVSGVYMVQWRTQDDVQTIRLIVK